MNVKTEKFKKAAIYLLIFLFIALTGFLILKKHVSSYSSGNIIVKSDIITYINASRSLINGDNIYFNRQGEPTSFVYPPFFAVLLAPASILPDLAIDIGWFILNILLIYLILKYSWFIFQKNKFEKLEFNYKFFLVSASVLLSVKFLIRNFADGNVNLLILFLVISGFYLLNKTGVVYWAALIGVAASIKIFPLVFIIYFAGRKKYKEAAIILAAFVILMFLPAVFTGFEKNLTYLQAFYNYASGMFAGSHADVENFSIFGTAARLFTKTESFRIAGVPVYINLLNFDINIIKFFIYLVNIIIVFLIFYSSAAEQKLINKGKTTYDFSFVITLLLMNQISVIIEEHHLVTYIVIYLFLLILIKNDSVRFGFIKPYLWLCGIIPILLSYDVIVPLAGKNSYMFVLSYSLPVILIFFILLTLIFISYKKIKA